MSPLVKKQRRNASQPDPWLSVRQAATALGIAPQTVYARAADGLLVTMKAAGRTFIHRESVAELRAAQSEAA
jgi:hypothetical protein